MSQVKKPVYDMEADIELPPPVEEGMSDESDVEVEDEEDLDDDECKAVEAIIGFDPRTVEGADAKA